MAEVVTMILLDGHPKGFRAVEVDNWPGKALVVPRSKLSEIRTRSEAGQEGLYFLIGDSEQEQAIYIGQSHNVVERLFQHDASRPEDEWNSAVLFVGGLDSTSISTLEHWAITEAKTAGRFTLLNRQNTVQYNLSEAQKITLEKYFDRVKIVMGVLGLSVFENPEIESRGSVFYHVKGEEAQASGKLLETQEFIVFKGSTARVRETPSYGKSARALRQFLIEEGILQRHSEQYYIFTKDYIFSSPSAASDVVKGRSTNGWTNWKDDLGKTLDENVRRGYEK